MKTCQNCGFEMPETAKFCGKCKTAFAAPTAQNMPSPSQPTYGLPPVTQSTYAAQQPEYPQSAYQQQYQPPQSQYTPQQQYAPPPATVAKKSKTPVMIGVSAACLVVVGLVIALAVSLSNGGSSSSSSNNGSSSGSSKDNDSNEDKNVHPIVGAWRYAENGFEVEGVAEVNFHEDGRFYMLEYYGYKEDNFFECKVSGGTYTISGDIIFLNFTWEFEVEGREGEGEDSEFYEEIYSDTEKFEIRGNKLILFDGEYEVAFTKTSSPHNAWSFEREIPKPYR